jgi:cell division protein FtsL
MTMLALAPKLRMYPVLMPDAPARDRRARVVLQRRRITPVTQMLIVISALVLPAIAYVHQTAAAAHTGYMILELRQDVRALQIENADLFADVMHLRAPERIERIAFRDLGMLPPDRKQVGSLEIAAKVATVRPARVSWQERLRGLILDREAAAAESR